MNFCSGPAEEEKEMWLDSFEGKKELLKDKNTFTRRRQGSSLYPRSRDPSPEPRTSAPRGLRVGKLQIFHLSIAKATAPTLTSQVAADIDPSNLPVIESPLEPALPCLDPNAIAGPLAVVTSHHISKWAIKESRRTIEVRNSAVERREEG